MRALGKEPTSLGRRWRLSFIWCGLCFALAGTSLRFGPEHPINQVAPTLVTPLRITAQNLGMSVRNRWQGLVDQVEEGQRVQVLEEELGLANSKLHELQGMKNEIARLKAQLEFSESRKDLDLLAGEVIATEGSLFAHRIRVRISSSLQRKISAGSPVIAGETLIGQVIRAGADDVEVMLLTDPRSAVDVRAEDGSTTGIAVGTQSNTPDLLMLKYAENSQELAPNLVFRSTGRDGRFPEGLIVARTYSSSKPDIRPTAGVVLKTASTVSGLRYVFVVVGRTGLSSDGKSYRDSEP